MEMRVHSKPSNLTAQRREAMRLREEVDKYHDLIAAEERTMKVTTDQVDLYISRYF